MGRLRSTTSETEVQLDLYRAAEQATLAPSILNTQPWRLVVHPSRLELFADLDRVVTSIDPEYRLMTISCGAALHHACLALRAHGLTPGVARYPESGRDDHLATIAIDGEHPATRTELNLALAARERRSDRRPVAAGPRVHTADVDQLRRAATTCDAHLAPVGDHQKPFLATAARAAQTIEGRDEPYQHDLIAWTDDRPRGAGVSPQTLVADGIRPVPLRDFPGGGEIGLDPGLGDDANADYLILATDDDTSIDWLRAGEALSLVWLTATTLGIAASVLSNVIEVPGARTLVRSLLPEPGNPQVVLRIGVATHAAPPPASPRRRPEAVITIDET
jgi:hypothetical protein